MNEATCPPDHAWMPLLAGETVEASVRGHLDTCTTCRGRFQQAQAELTELRSFASVRDATDSGQASALRERPPATIGKYLVVGALDTGGQAKVYRALHPVLDKEVVIKLSRTPVDPDSPEGHLLVTEGKLLAALEHPHMARTVDLDFHEDRPYLVMEYVRGRNLSRWAEEEHLDPREAARIVAAIARAMAVVHCHGVIHQDIKPQNILIDENGQPRVIDFGLARLGHAWADGPSQPSGGTPAYMAPEQARGEESRISPRSDVFALGGVLYFLLTGKTPFDGGALSEVVGKASRGEFDRAALQAPKVPSRLAAICLRAMATDPAQRHSTAEELARDLERYVNLPRTIARRAAISAGVLSLAFGIAAAFFWPRPLPPLLPTEKPKPELTVHILRGDKRLTLTEAFPLRTGRDLLQVRGTIPRNSRPVLFLVSQNGSVERLEVDVSPGDETETLIFPRERKRATLLDGGTEVVLLLAGPRDEKALEEVEKLLRALGPWPPMPSQGLAWLDRERARTDASGRPFGETRADPASKIEQRLDDLRLKLRERFDVILGVAFSHQAE